MAVFQNDSERPFLQVANSGQRTGAVALCELAWNLCRRLAFIPFLAWTCLPPAHAAEEEPTPFAPTSEARPAAPGAATSPGAGSQTAPSSAATLDDLKARTKEIKDLSVDGEATLVGTADPIGVTFEGSKRVSMLVADDLNRRGYKASADAVNAPTQLRLRARVVLNGPDGQRAFMLGPAFEKILDAKSDAERIDIDPLLRAPQAALALGATKGLYNAGVFNAFTYQYFSVLALSDALGIRGGFNKALTGDARGVCLINCDNWKNTLHVVTIYAFVTTNGQERRAMSNLKAWLTEIDPQTTFDIAYEALLQERLTKPPQ